MRKTLVELFCDLLAKAPQIDLFGGPDVQRVPGRGRTNPNLRPTIKTVTRGNKTFTQTYYEVPEAPIRPNVTQGGLFDAPAPEPKAAPSSPETPSGAAHPGVTQGSLFDPPPASAATEGEVHNSPYRPRPVSGSSRQASDRTVSGSSRQASDRTVSGSSRQASDRAVSATRRQASDRTDAAQEAVALLQALGVAEAAVQAPYHLKLINPPHAPLTVETTALGGHPELTFTRYRYAPDGTSEGIEAEVAFRVGEGGVSLVRTREGERSGNDEAFAARFLEELAEQGFGRVPPERREGLSAPGALSDDERANLAEGALHVGDTKVEGGVTYRLNDNHRWERVEDASGGDAAGDGAAPPEARPPARPAMTAEEARAHIHKLLLEGGAARTTHDEAGRPQQVEVVKDGRAVFRMRYDASGQPSAFEEVDEPAPPLGSREDAGGTLPDTPRGPALPQAVTDYLGRLLDPKKRAYAQAYLEHLHHSDKPAPDVRDFGDPDKLEKVRKKLVKLMGKRADDTPGRPGWPGDPADAPPPAGWTEVATADVAPGDHVTDGAVSGTVVGAGALGAKGLPTWKVQRADGEIIAVLQAGVKGAWREPRPEGDAETPQSPGDDAARAGPAGSGPVGADTPPPTPEPPDASAQAAAPRLAPLGAGLAPVTDPAEDAQSRRGGQPLSGPEREPRGQEHATLKEVSAPLRGAVQRRSRRGDVSRARTVIHEAQQVQRAAALAAADEEIEALKRRRAELEGDGDKTPSTETGPGREQAGAAPPPDASGGVTAPRATPARPETEAPSAPAPATAAPTPPGPAAPPLVGLPEGATQSQRRAWNDEAVRLSQRLTAEGRTATPEEKAILGRYSGTGGVGASLNEFYTPPELAKSLWDVLAKLGSGTGRGLEPSAGTGVMLQHAPEGTEMTAVELSPTSGPILEQLFGDRHTVHNVSFETFSTGAGAGERFDFVIGNPPFCERDTASLDMPDERRAERYFTLKTLAHLKEGGVAVLVLPAGLLRNKGREALEFRRKVLANAEVLAVHGLPTRTFARAHTEVATTDVWVLRRRNEDLARALEASTLEEMQHAGVLDQPFLTGDYHEAHPELAGGGGYVTGEGKFQRFVRDGELTPEVLAGLVASTPVTEPASVTLGDYFDALTRAGKARRVSELRGKLWRGEQEKMEGKVRTSESGKLQVCRNGHWTNIETEASVDAFDQGALLAEQLKLHGQLLAQGDVARANALRPRLQALLEQFARTHGNPHDNADLKAQAKRSPVLSDLFAAFEADGTLRAHYLEDKAVDSTLDRNDVHSVMRHLRRTGQRPTLDNIDAVYGKPGASRENLVDALFVAGYNLTPAGEWVPAGEYYVGDAYALLEQIDDMATRVAPDSPERRALAWQRAEVAARIVKTPLEEIELTPSLPWLPEEIVKAYAAHAARAATGTEVYPESFAIDRDAKGYVEVRYTGYRYDYLNAADKKAFNFVKKYLTAKGRRKDDDDLFKQADEDFKFWLTSEGYRDTVEELYARRTGAWLEPRYDTSDLGKEIAGWNPAVKLHWWQSEAARRALAQGGGIIALDVGLGKTFTSIAMTLQAKAEGHAQKPVIAVPKSVVANWRKEFLEAKPDAKLLIIGAEPVYEADGNTIARDEDGNEVWREVAGARALDAQLAQMRVGDFDAIIMTHTTLGRIPMSNNQLMELVEREFNLQRGAVLNKPAGMSNTMFESYAAAYAQKLIDAGELKLEDLAKFTEEKERLERELKDLAAKKWLSEAEKRDKAAKQDAKQRANFFLKAAKRLQGNGNDLKTTWESLGVDYLLLDEGHQFKGLWEPTGSRQSVKYLGAGQTSDMAMDLYYKCLEMRTRTGGRGVYMATATPIKNSPVELYNMLSYTAPEVMKHLGVHNLDAFIERYCRIDTMVVPTEDMGLETVQYLAGLKNLGELRREAAKFINRKTAEQVGLALPRKNTRFELLRPEREQAERLNWITANPLQAMRDYLGASDIPDGIERKRGTQAYNDLLDRYRLALAHLTRRAELDLEMIDPVRYKGHISPKVRAFLKDAVREIKAGEKLVVFCDTKDMPDPQGALTAPKGKAPRNPNGYSFHEKLRNLICERTNLKPNEVAIANADHMPSAEDRLRASRDFASGKVKVVIGNTETMGQGMNLQKGVKNLFHLDVPWNPALLQQREGRVVRQGNTVDEVSNRFYMGTRGLDKTMMDVLSGKTNWYEEFWNGESDEIASASRSFVPSLEMITAMGIADDGEREAAYAAIRERAENDQRTAKRVKLADTFRKYQRLAYIIYHHERKHGPERKREREGMQAQLAAMRERLKKDPEFAPFTRALEVPLTCLIDPISGSVVQRGDRTMPAPDDQELEAWQVSDIDPVKGRLTLVQIDHRGEPQYFSGFNRKRGAYKRPITISLSVSEYARKRGVPLDPAAFYQRIVARSGGSALSQPQTPEEAAAARRGLLMYAQNHPDEDFVVKRGSDYHHVLGSEVRPDDHFPLPGDGDHAALQSWLNDSGAQRAHIEAYRKDHANSSSAHTLQDNVVIGMLAYRSKTPHKALERYGYLVEGGHKNGVLVKAPSLPKRLVLHLRRAEEGVA